MDHSLNHENTLSGEQKILLTLESLIKNLKHSLLYLDQGYYPKYLRSISASLNETEAMVHLSAYWPHKSLKQSVEMLLCGVYQTLANLYHNENRDELKRTMKAIQMLHEGWVSFLKKA